MVLTPAQMLGAVWAAFIWALMLFEERATFPHARAINVSRYLSLEQRRVARIEAHGANTKARATATGRNLPTSGASSRSSNRNRRFAVAARHAAVLADRRRARLGRCSDRRSSALLRFRRPPSCDHSVLRRRLN
jgi:hypothetical protein